MDLVQKLEGLLRTAVDKGASERQKSVLLAVGLAVESHPVLFRTRDAFPLLVTLLGEMTKRDELTVVATLLELYNLGLLAETGAMPGIIDVSKAGRPEAG